MSTIHFYICENKKGSTKFGPVPASEYAMALKYAREHSLFVVMQTWELVDSETVDNFTNPETCCCCGDSVNPDEELSFEEKPICEGCFDVVD